MQNHFSDLTFFFDFEFKNTSNLIFPGFKVPSERFFFKTFKTGPTFCHMRFFNFQNLVRSCQPLGGTLCISLKDLSKRKHLILLNPLIFS